MFVLLQKCHTSEQLLKFDWMNDLKIINLDFSFKNLLSLCKTFSCLAAFLHILVIWLSKSSL